MLTKVTLPTSAQRQPYTSSSDAKDNHAPVVFLCLSSELAKSAVGSPKGFVNGAHRSIESKANLSNIIIHHYHQRI